MKNSTKGKVEYWLNKHPSLRDDDNRLCSNIWGLEIYRLQLEDHDINTFLKLYAQGKLTSAPSIKRARAKLQEENPELRGQKYNNRKGILQDKWKQKLGYNV